MKRIIYSVMALSMLAFTACSEETATDENAAENTADATTENSEAISGEYLLAAGNTITWKAKKLGGPDYVHVGTVNVEDGEVTVVDNKITNGEFEISVASLNEGDSEMNEKFENHVKNDTSWFNVGEYPMAVYKITGTEGNTIMGELSYYGMTYPLNLEGETTITPETVSFKGTGNIDFEKVGVPSLQGVHELPEEEKATAPDPEAMFEINLTLAAAADA